MEKSRFRKAKCLVNATKKPGLRALVIAHEIRLFLRDPFGTKVLGRSEWVTGTF